MVELEQQTPHWQQGLNSRHLPSPTPHTLVQQPGVCIQQLWHQMLHTLHDVWPQGSAHRFGAGLEADAGISTQCLLWQRMGDKVGEGREVRGQAGGKPGGRKPAKLQARSLASTCSHPANHPP